MKRWTALCLILLVTGLAGAGICLFAGRKNSMDADYISGTAKEEKLIVTSFYPVYIMALNLTEGVSGVSVVNLSENHNGCLHDYQLTTENMRLLEKASLFIVNGGGMESFLEDVGKNCKNLEIVSVSENIEAEQDEFYAENGHEDSRGDGHNHEENSHYWMDPALYMMQIECLSGELKKWDSENSEKYGENGKLYCDKVRKLSDRMDLELDGLSGINIISFNEAFYYLGKRLNVNTVHTLNLDGEVYLGAGEVAGILDEIKEKNVGFLWMEQSVKQDLRELLLKEADKTVMLDALIQGEDDRDSYLKGMEKNIDSLKTMLK